MSEDGGAGLMLDRAHDAVVLEMPNANVVRGKDEIRIREDKGMGTGHKVIFHTLMVLLTAGLWLLVLPFILIFVRGGVTKVREDEGTLGVSGDQKARVGALLRKEGLPCR